MSKFFPQNRPSLTVDYPINTRLLLRDIKVETTYSNNLGGFSPNQKVLTLLKFVVFKP